MPVLVAGARAVEEAGELACGAGLEQNLNTVAPPQPFDRCGCWAENLQCSQFFVEGRRRRAHLFRQGLGFAFDRLRVSLEKDSGQAPERRVAQLFAGAQFSSSKGSEVMFDRRDQAGVVWLPCLHQHAAGLVAAASGIPEFALPSGLYGITMYLVTIPGMFLLKLLLR